MATNDADQAPKLRGWKEISRHLRADERTARRWEQRGMPVHRLPGAGRSAVFADAAELDQWLHRHAAADPDPSRTAQSAPGQPIDRHASAASKRSWLPIVAPLALATAGLAIWSAAPTHSILGPAIKPAGTGDARAAALAEEARAQNARGTAAGFRRAIALSEAAVARDPRNAAAYAEESLAYIRLPDDDGRVDRRVAYERAQRAAQHALDIDPNSWRAHSTMGFIEYGYNWNLTAGIRHFRAVIRINPSRGPGHNQLGLALLNMGDTKGALAELKLSTELETANPIYQIYYAEALYVAGDRRQAMTKWRQIVGDNPNNIAARTMIMTDAFARRDYREALADGEKIARLRHDQNEIAMYGQARHVLTTSGPRAALILLLRDAQRSPVSGDQHYLDIARIDSLLGDKDAAFDALGRALTAREPYTLMMRNDPLLSPIRDDPRFERLAAAHGITLAALAG